MAKQERLREAKQHGAAWFPFNIYPCTIPKDFPQVALHWQDSMELVFVKKGRGIVQAGLTTYTAQAGDIYVFAPGVLHALRQLPGEAMEYENIIFELELLGGAGDICAEKYLLPLQSGRLALPMRLEMCIRDRIPHCTSNPNSRPYIQSRAYFAQDGILYQVYCRPYTDSLCYSASQEDIWAELKVVLDGFA